MLTLHHLNDSRSQRILWLLEELGIPYEMKRYQRDATTRLAPPELTAVHPLGKSPVITDGEVRIAESGAIVDYIIRRYGGGKMMPAPGGAEYEAYNEWLHYSEGSAMLPLMLNLYVGRLKEAGAPLHPRIDSEMANHLGYVDRALKGREFLIGQSLSGDRSPVTDDPASACCNFARDRSSAAGSLSKPIKCPGAPRRFAISELCPPKPTVASR